MAVETTYHYAVLARSQDGDGAQSATLSVTTPAAPKKTKDNPQRQTRQTAQTTFISNMGQTRSASKGSAGGASFDAQQFTTGSNEGGYTLSAIVVKLAAASSATPTFALHQSTTVSGVDVPGTKVVDLTGSVATAGEQSFTPASATTLSASTKYIVVVAGSGGRISTRKALSGNEDSGGSPGWSIADNTIYSTNSGSTWFTSTTAPLKIAVKGTAVTTAPEFESATASGTSLVITFDEDLAAAASLANSAFEVKKTPTGGSEATVVTLSTTVAPVISGKTVTLTLATALLSTDTVTVTYNEPTTGTANKLVDAATNETGTFTDRTVTNNTAPPQQRRHWRARHYGRQRVPRARGTDRKQGDNYGHGRGAGRIDVHLAVGPG